MMPKFYIFAAFVLFATYTFAQDVHFTQYEMTPGHVNPANTGGFYGSYRIGGIYRDQSLSATGEEINIGPHTSTWMQYFHGD